ncbi:MAG TPA: hypothetical protein VNI01_08035 [Elusimicrobiota bacterium]|jgi:hypothetical protein|nr:hypothetical protein [Elusimicrobiota bacterium]
MSQHGYCIGAVVAVLVAFLYLSYREGWLDSWRGIAPFVGAYARTPGMEGCMAFNDPGGRSMRFNRCAYV